MGTNSFVPTAASRRRSFSLPGFRRSSAAERQEALKNANGTSKSSVDEAVRIQKAAAWQWYTRGVGEAALLAPTKRPVRKNPQVAPVAAATSCGKANVITCNRNMSPIQQKTAQPPPAEVHRAAPSRFKAEAAAYASSPAKPAGSTGAPPAAAPLRPVPSGDPATPLYDELELSTVRADLADLVQQVRQHQHTAHNEQSHFPAAAGDRGKSKPPPPPAVDVAAFSEHKPTVLPSSPAPVASTFPFHIKPFSALQKLFRKVLAGSVPKCTRSSSQSIASTEALFDDADSTTSEYHHHHYIHHHHHHYHFSESPEERSSIIPRRRRSSESASSRPWVPPRLMEDAGSDDDEDEVDEAEEESRIAAYLARRRRRHSDSFSKHQLQPETADFEKDEEMKEAKLPMQFSRQYNSERYLASRIPAMAVGQEFAQHVAEVEFARGVNLEGIRSRRRRSADFHREEPCLEWTGGKSDQGGAYKLGGCSGGAGGRMPASMTMGGRRHSESSKERPEATARLAPSPGGRYWKSPSARYYVDERHDRLPPPASAGTTAKFNVALPPVYPQ